MSVSTKQIKNKKISQIVTWSITIIMALAILFIAFVKLVPGFGMYIVRSDSMKPGISAGDVIFTGPASQVKPGDIITFKKDTMIVTHRVVSVENGLISTKGDANEEADPGKIAITAVQGSYMFKVPGIGYITNFTNTKKGWFFMVIVPTIILVLFLVKDILKEAFKDDKKKPAAGFSPVMQTVTVGAESGMMSNHQAKAAYSEPAARVVKQTARPEVVKPVTTEVKVAETKKVVAAQVFSNKEVNDNIRSEMKKILAGLS